jgi:hypothetical protein
MPLRGYPDRQVEDTLLRRNIFSGRESGVGRCCRKSRKLSSPKNLAKICFQLPLLLQAAVGHVRSPVVAFLWSMWSLTSACVGRASGAEKFRPPPQKYFFDSIGQNEPPAW